MKRKVTTIGLLLMALGFICFFVYEMRTVVYEIPEFDLRFEVPSGYYVYTDNAYQHIDYPLMSRENLERMRAILSEPSVYYCMIDKEGTFSLTVRRYFSHFVDFADLDNEELLACIQGGAFLLKGKPIRKRI